MELEGDRCASRHIDCQIETSTLCKDGSEIYFQLMSRYSKSPARHHRHLLATAAAIRSILSANESPLNPSSYFTVAIENLSNPELLDSTEVSALLSMISIVVPLIPKGEMVEVKKVRVVAEVLAGLMNREDLGAAAISAALKCLGAVMVDVCELEDWDSVRDGFKTVLAFTVDRRPKVRRTARESLEKLFKSFRSVHVVKEGSKSVLQLLLRYMPLPPKLKGSEMDGVKGEEPARPENLEFLHLLNLLKLVVPYLSEKSSSTILSDLIMCIPSSFSGATRLLLENIETYFKTASDQIISPHIDNLIDILSAHVSTSEKNPVDIVMLAVTLLKTSLSRLYTAGSSWPRKNRVPKVLGSVAGLLLNSDGIASWSSNIMKELITCYIKEATVLADDGVQSFQDASPESEDAAVIVSACQIFESILRSCSGVPNEHILSVIALLFQKLGKNSFPFMKTIVLKLADVMNNGGQDVREAVHLQNCFGSAVAALGPERILALVPISLCVDGLTCTNTWLLPIMKRHVNGASLSCYIDHIVPLAIHFQRASLTARKTSAVGQDIQAHARSLWELLSSFCRYPVDCYRNFGSLAKLLLHYLKKKKSFMHENIAIALQLLVNQNRTVLCRHDIDDDSASLYSKKTAKRNMRSIKLCSSDLLHALMCLFVDSNVKKRLCLKDAIGCVASVTDSSAVKDMFTSLLKKFHIVNDEGEFAELKVGGREELNDEDHSDLGGEENAAKRERLVVLELATSLVGSVKEELVDFIYNFILFSIQGADQLLIGEAYRALSGVLVKHRSFSSGKYSDVVDLLLGLKPPSMASSLRNRFACFNILVVQILEMSSSLENEDLKVLLLLLLKEIILTLKVKKGESRKVAFDALLAMSNSLRKSSCSSSSEPYHNLFHVILGWLPGSSPSQMKSGAISALSVLVHSDPDVCIKIPHLVTSVVSLLHKKAVEIIKAVLGFVKVLVSCVGTRDLPQFLPDIAEILPWSRFSRHHFKSKVTAILEIVMRRSSYAAVEFVTPEKYKRFVKSVFQNRRHHSSMSAATSDSKTVLGNVSSKRETDKVMPKTKSKKRERENKQNSRRITSCTALCRKRRKMVGDDAVNDTTRKRKRDRGDRKGLDNGCEAKRTRKPRHPKRENSGGKTQRKGQELANGSRAGGKKRKTEKKK